MQLRDAGAAGNELSGRVPGRESRSPSLFSNAEIDYLTTARMLGRIATAARDGTLHVAPVGFTLNLEDGVVEVRGRELVRTKKFRDVARTGRAAIVIDDVLPPWRPRGVEVRGRAEAVEHPRPVIRIHPERIVSWGLDQDGAKGRNVGSSHD